MTKKTEHDKGYNPVNQRFFGEISLGNELTHYTTCPIISNIAVTLKANPIIGGSAEVRMVGDGVHTPVFGSVFTKSKNSEDYDTTLATENKVVFYFDGYQAFYSITVLE